ncbi:uncharacterized protein JCM6883_005508 [Sporobolomyces salmoneus]|uniref:uncharacterized protein n=1 Tax=Sporobolomyces salmoneus TaxID=183962 RepID=UPI003180F4EF
MGQRRSRATTPRAPTTSIVPLLLLSRSSYAQSVAARWGQSSLLLSPSSTPHLLISSGKTFIAGQTILSTPSTNSFLSLDLSQPILDLSNPPWATPTNAGDSEDEPIGSYATFLPLNQTSGLFFGGDSMGDPRVPVQTRSDSSYLFSITPSNNEDESAKLTTKWTSQTTAWTSQPERREFSLSTSASNGKVTRNWIYGGLRADVSGIGFDELWEMRITLASGNVEWARSTSQGGPIGGELYDGIAVLVPSTTRGGQPTIYFVGGVETKSNALATLSTIYAFTPSSTIAEGAWTTLSVNTTSTTVPSPRRGHSAVYLGNRNIWISGGRDLTGTVTYADSWVLDLDSASWTRVSDANEASWGSSTVVLGETILSTFGYGTNAPASTSLRVYAFENDTWLNSYYPSYLTSLPSNPKAGGSDSGSVSSSSPTSSSGGSSSNPSNPKARPDSSSSAPSDSSSSTSSSSDSSSDNPNDDSETTWTSPGTPQSPSDSDSTNNKGDKSEKGPSKSLVAGAVVGSLLGALALAAIGVYGMRKRKRSAMDGRDRYTGGGGGFIVGGKRIKRGDYADDEEEYMDMMEKPGRNFSPREGGGGLTGLFATTTTPRMGGMREGLGGVGVAMGMGMGKRRRFDMLRDEEEEEDEKSQQRGWTRFDDEDDEQYDALSTGRGRIASDISDESTRIGVGIWGGMGLGRSESVRSGTSYLGTNLGGFLRSESTAGHEYGGLASGAERGDGGDASLTPIAEWEEDEDEDEDGTMESGLVGGGGGDYSSGRSGGTRSTETHQTRSTLTNSQEEASIKTATRVVRPFSPSSSSLYGSGFATPVPFSVPTSGGGGGIERSTSTSSSLFMSPIRRDNSSSWWSRLKQHQHSEIPTATAFEAIRDPTPAPNLDEQQRSIDPFSDPVPGPLDRSNSLNEHGLMATRSQRGIHDRSVSSNVSEVTATSSVLEERMRGMDVVQRIRTGEGSDGSASIGTGGGNSTETTPEISQNPFSDPDPVAQTPGSVIFAGSQAAFSPRTPSSPPPPVPSIPQFPLLPVILPPTPTRSQDPTPHSPRKTRLIGPRPQPSQALPTISRSGSVKDLVAEIERRNSLPSPPSTNPMSPNPSPSKAGRSKTTTTNHGNGHGQGRKVEHGLVKKPKLYVANP